MFVLLDCVSTDWVLGADRCGSTAVGRLLWPDCLLRLVGQMLRRCVADHETDRQQLQVRVDSTASQLAGERSRVQELELKLQSGSSVDGEMRITARVGFRRAVGGESKWEDGWSLPVDALCCCWGFHMCLWFAFSRFFFVFRESH